jgi:cell pole-organizing protein PopZ
MEEILASIRRILNEDPATDAAATAEPDDGVLVLDKSMMREPADAAPLAPEPEAPTAELLAPAVAPVEAVADAAPEAPTPQSEAAPAPDLVAPEAAAAAATAMGTLMRTLVADRRPKVWSEGPTLEDLVRITLRPLLKEWLDANLPPIVERLVRAEIERVVGRVIP